MSHHPRHDREVDRDWHVQNGFQCTAHGSVLSPSTTRFMLSPTPSDGDEHFGVHSSWASCSLAVATALAKAALPKKIRKCTTFPPRRHLVLLLQALLRSRLGVCAAEQRVYVRVSLPGHEALVHMHQRGFVHVSDCSMWPAESFACDAVPAQVSQKVRAPWHDQPLATAASRSRSAQHSQLHHAKHGHNRGTSCQLRRTFRSGSHRCLSCIPRR